MFSMYRIGNTCMNNKGCFCLSTCMYIYRVSKGTFCTCIVLLDPHIWEFLIHLCCIVLDPLGLLSLLYCRLIRLTSPNLNYIIGVGVVIFSLSVFMFVYPPLSIDVLVYHCGVSMFTLSRSFCPL